MLATASLGAIWSSCSPDFGRPRRRRPVHPDRAGRAVRRRRLPLRRQALRHPRDGRAAAGRAADAARHRAGALPRRRRDAARHAALARHRRPSTATLAFEYVPFDAPMWVLYSSGTTGLPKPIVHCQGGILLEHLKQLALHLDLGPRRPVLLVQHHRLDDVEPAGVRAVRRVGDRAVRRQPDAPGAGRAVAARRARRASPASGCRRPYLQACMKAELRPEPSSTSAALRSVGSTGAPLPPEGFAWVYDAVKSDVLLSSLSGGTDVCTAFVGGAPTLPVRAGVIPCRLLGCAVDGLRRRRPAADRRGRRAGDHRADAVDAGRVLERPGRRAAARGLLRRLTRACGATATGSRSTRTARASSTAARTRPSTAAACGWARPSSTGSSRSCPAIADSLVIDTSARRRREGRLLLYVVLDRRATALDDVRDELRAAIRAQPVAAPRPGRDRGHRRGAAHAQRQEVRGAGQAGAGRACRSSRRSAAGALKNPDAMAPFLAGAGDRRDDAAPGPARARQPPPRPGSTGGCCAGAVRHRSPATNRLMTSASTAANRSMLWIGLAGVLAATGERRPRARPRPAACSASASRPRSSTGR